MADTFLFIPHTSESTNKCQCGFHCRDGVLITTHIAIDASTLTEEQYLHCPNFTLFLDTSKAVPLQK